MPRAWTSHRSKNLREKLARGFTLVEILIVIIVLGILAAIITPGFANAAEGARQTSFAQNNRAYAAAVDRFRIENSRYPVDSNTGTLPAEMIPYINPAEFSETTPIGGRWDIESFDSGVTCAVGVHFNGDGQTRDDAYMTIIDQILDNGDLETGRFQRIGAGRYYVIVAP